LAAIDIDWNAGLLRADGIARTGSVRIGEETGMSSESTPTTSTASSEPSLQRKSVSLACGLFWVLL